MITRVTLLTQARAQAKFSEPAGAFLHRQQRAKRKPSSIAENSFATNDGNNARTIDGSAAYVWYARAALRNSPIQRGYSASLAIRSIAIVPTKLQTRRLRSLQLPIAQSTSHK